MRAEKDAMTRPREAAHAVSAEDCLQRALGAANGPARVRWAQRGLALDSSELAPDTQVLLLRQIYLAHLEASRFDKAVELAEQMAAIGPLKDVAHHDAARALAAQGELARAVEAQRLAARHAPPERRSFHLWSLATWQHFDGDVAGALRSLEKAQRWAHTDRALIRAHAAYVKLTADIAVPSLDRVVDELARSGAREGYGQWLLGMIAYQLGDRRKAAAHLRAFLRRHAAADAPKAITLREELRRARVALAEFESH